jgi:hypothetical protein
VLKESVVFAATAAAASGQAASKATFIYGQTCIVDVSGCL